MYSLPVFPEYTAPALIFFAVFLLYFRLSTDGLRHIPGPLLARTPVWLAYQTRMANRYCAVDQVHKVSSVLFAVVHSDTARVQVVWARRSHFTEPRIYRR